jgi:hypothetical protein
MKVTEIKSSSGYQTYLHLALDDAVAEYQKVQSAVAQQPPLTEETATPELTMLRHSLEQKRATVILLAASCVEAAANLYLGLKSTPEQFAVLERATFLEKWTVLPSLFVSGYTFPKDGELYQDLKRIHARRNALAHLKEKVSFGGVILHPGSLPESAGDEHVFLGRCRSLPKRLVSHLASFDKTEALKTIQTILAGADIFREMRRSLTRQSSGCAEAPR